MQDAVAVTEMTPLPGRTGSCMPALPSRFRSGRLPRRARRCRWRCRTADRHRGPPPGRPLSPPLALPPGRHRGCAARRPCLSARLAAARPGQAGTPPVPLRQPEEAPPRAAAAALRQPRPARKPAREGARRCRPQLPFAGTGQPLPCREPGRTWYGNPCRGGRRPGGRPPRRHASRPLARRTRPAPVLIPVPGGPDEHCP